MVGSFFLLPLRAEDWTTLDGKVYHDVRVLSQTPAYVTIMHQDGGGQVPLSNLPPDLQQRFNYSAAAAAKYLADTAAAAKANKEALAKEKARVAAAEAAQQEAQAEAFFVALFSLPPDRDVPAASTNAVASDSDSVPPPDASAPPTQPIASEPPTEVDDWGYGNYGYSYYGGYPYYGYSYGYRGYRGGWGHHGNWGNRSYRIPTTSNPSNVQVYPKH